MFRSMSRLILASLFVMLILGADAPPIPIENHLGTQADPMLVYNSETVATVFDDSYTASGITIVRIDEEILSSSGESIGVWTMTTGWKIEGAIFKVPIRTQALTLPNGVYQAHVRVWDSYGNISQWSSIIWISKQWRNLQAPGGCKIVS